MELIFLLAFFGLLLFFYIKSEENRNKKRSEKSKLIKEFESAYRCVDTDKLEEELKKTDDDFNDLVQRARYVYRKNHPEEESVYDYLGYDKSEYIRAELDLPLYAKRYAIETILEHRIKFGDNIHANNHSISSKLFYKDSDGKMHEVKYNARIDFDFNCSLAFFYDSNIKKEIPILDDYVQLFYDDIISVEVKNNSLVFKVKNDEYIRSKILKYINFDFKETKNYLSFELETSTPKEIKKIIDRILDPQEVDY